MKKIITESQIRFVVRNELKNYLVQEGFFSDFAKTGKEIFGSENIKKALSHAVGREYTPSSEYGQIAAILTPLQVNSQSLKPAYEMLYKKDKSGNFVVTMDDKQKTNFLNTINEIEQILKPFLVNRTRETIPAPMQEAAGSTTTSAPRSFTAPRRASATTTAQTKLNNTYTKLQGNYNSSKAANDIAGILTNAVTMYICSVANLILKTRNLQPQQISQIQKFFEILKEHAEKIKPAPAEPPATTPTGSIP